MTELAGIIEIDATCEVSREPFWIVSCLRPADTVLKRLPEIERMAIAESGVTADYLDGLPPTYRSEADCRRVIAGIKTVLPLLVAYPQRCGAVT